VACQKRKLTGEWAHHACTAVALAVVGIDEPIPRIVYNIQIVSPNSDADAKAIVENGAKGCPAFKAMERAARIEVNLEHNGKKIHAQVYGVQ
jgi:uncharacterized OsmC-like protein